MKLGSMTFSVGKKLFVAFMILIVLLCVLGGTSLLSEKSMSDKTESIASNWMAGVEIANNVNYLTEHVLTYQYKILTAVDKTKKTDYMVDASSTLLAIDQQLDAYAATYASDEDKATAESLRDKWNRYKKLYEEAVSVSGGVDLINGAKAKGDEIVQVMESSEEAYAAMQEDMAKLVQLNHKGAADAAQESKDIYRSSIVKAIAVLAASIVIAVALVLLMNARISKPIKRVSQTLLQVADGDLTVPALAAKSKDEIGTLVRSVNGMTANLKTTMYQIHQAAGTVAASSEELLASSEQNAEATQHVAEAVQEVAAGADRQQHSALETSRAMEEMATGIQRIAETSSTVSELTVEASELATQGNQSILSAVERMDAIGGSVGQAGADIRLLEAHSGRIGEIVGFIGDIAKQTSLLSLNASIEAARAGEHGKGFAVVAGEVKKLSEQSAQSVQNIADVIAQIQTDTLKAVRTMDQSQSEVRLGIQAVSDAELAFRRIADTAALVSDKVQEVAAAAQQMAAGSEQVTASVQDMSAISRNAAESTQAVAATTEQQLASVQEIAAAAQSLSGIALELSDLVGKFKA
ncbi:methyl-accepting chemotaxis protein [Paenibacillus glycinis]|uniref:HAMP domain-containing protein n=1 Tax=Paenibacillus glycinis TaxID=2697035 RepID=A0ABW9XNF8_9BACL|nr:methyl-accepting chemotaxis protein [Paenibacillus glycinis]NBD24155.1 HAMP domain-containing protein [Paenibacillus glycinis]